MTISAGELVRRNAVFAATGAFAGLPFPTSDTLQVLGCVDSRVDPSDVLGLELSVVRLLPDRAVIAVRNAVAATADGVKCHNPESLGCGWRGGDDAGPCGRRDGGPFSLGAEWERLRQGNADLAARSARPVAAQRPWGVRGGNPPPAPKARRSTVGRAGLEPATKGL
ncbi:hypothetical protein GCM10022255_103200 [Dactylosporangium darangshiense]|uniref:Uncharacterized protein n=1 Tax=Dactylosporangium darangshiense TaxID=579108 RepID=A0ABP8DSZ9_9ACTN